MRGNIVVAALVLAAASAGSVRAHADEALRVGLLVASNQGGPGRPLLRYAEQDAGELARVLVQLGGFRPEHVHLVQGGSLAQIAVLVRSIKDGVAGARARGQRTVVLFYFSGHSDGQSLELGPQSWAFADVRRDLLQLGADVRIVIVDSCRSGALLADKGGTPGPTFDIRFTDDLATSGEAVLTSSAADEMALESREIRASFFSHHFVSGLRGAADASGDGRVTLGEAYRYAFVNTLLATSNTLNGPQHPGYDYRLTGQGELVLTDLQIRGARLSLPRAFDRILIADANRRHLVAELTNGSAHLVALPAGRYVVQGRLGGHAQEAAVDLQEGITRTLALAEFAPSDGSRALAKGDDELGLAREAAEPAPARAWRMGAGLGATRGVAEALSWAGLLRVDASLGDGRGGWALRLDLMSGDATGFRESAAQLGLGRFLEWHRPLGSLQAGWRIVGGPIWQTVDGGPRFWTIAAGTGPWARAALALGRGFELGLTLGADGLLLRRDQNVQAVWRPLAALGLEVDL